MSVQRFLGLAFLLGAFRAWPWYLDLSHSKLFNEVIYGSIIGVRKGDARSLDYRLSLELRVH